MQILREHKLTNGLKISFYNASRQVAGDRWLVELKLVSKIPLTEEMIADIDRREGGEFIKEKFQGHILFELERKKHFVDENLVDETLEELIDLAQTNLTEYFEHPDFAQRLYAKRVLALEEEFFLARKIQLNESRSDDVEEPDDFSACFK